MGLLGTGPHGWDGVEGATIINVLPGHPQKASHLPSSLAPIRRTIFKGIKNLNGTCLAILVSC